MILRLLIIAFAQALSTGAVTTAVAMQNWVVVAVAAFVLNVLWWQNMGNRIDVQTLASEHPSVGVAYALVFSAGVTLGTWFWG